MSAKTGTSKGQPSLSAMKGRAVAGSKAGSATSGGGAKPSSHPVAGVKQRGAKQ